MLNKNILKRIIKLEQIKEHPYFANFAWDSLLHLNLEAGHKLKLDIIYTKESYPYLNYIKVIKAF